LQELDALGGGDTRVGQLEVCVQVVPAHAEGETSTAMVVSNEVIVRDPRVADKPQVRKYRVAATIDLSEGSGDAARLEKVGRPAVDWLWAGFNTCVMSYGQVGLGKTAGMYSEGGVCNGILRELFSRIAASPQREPFTVGISCWDLHDNDVVDIVGTAGGKVFGTTEVTTLQEASALLREARSRSRNWEAGSAVSNVAHSFVRIVLHDASVDGVSTLHLVDLVGAQASSWSARSSAAPSDTVNRKVVNQQLLVLGRVVTELSAAESEEEGKVLSSRASKLTQILYPMLGGNCKTFLMASISSSPNSYLDTLNTLRFAQRASKIRTACMRRSGVSVAELELEPRKVSTEIGSIESHYDHVLSSAVDKVHPEDDTSGESSFDEEELLPREDDVAVQQIGRIVQDLDDGDIDSAEFASAVAIGDVVLSPPPELEQMGLMSPSPSPAVATMLLEAEAAAAMMARRSSPAAMLHSPEEDQRPRAAPSPLQHGSPLLGEAAQQLRLDIKQSLDGILGNDTEGAASKAQQKRGGGCQLSKDTKAIEREVRQQQERAFAKPSRRATPQRRATVPVAPPITKSVRPMKSIYSPPAAEEGPQKGGVESMAKELSPAGPFMSVRAQREQQRQRVAEGGGGGVAGVAHAAAAADSFDEVALLKQNYQNLLQIIKNGEGKAEIGDSELDQIEAATQYELSIDNLKVENIELRSRLRKALKEGGYVEAFNLYEADITKLQKELGQLQQGRGAKAKAPASSQRQKVERLEEELRKVKAENLDMQKWKRHAAVQHKSWEDAGRRANRIQAEHERTKRELGAKEEALEEAHSRLVEAEREVVQLAAEKEAANPSEMRHLQRQVHSLHEKTRLTRLQTWKRDPVALGGKRIEIALDLARKIERKLARTGTARDAEGLVLELESIQRELTGQASRENEVTELLEEAQYRVEQLELAASAKKTKPLRAANRAVNTYRP